MTLEAARTGVPAAVPEGVETDLEIAVTTRLGEGSWSLGIAPAGCALSALLGD